jgi:hypothetical protein
MMQVQQRIRSAGAWTVHCGCMSGRDRFGPQQRSTRSSRRSSRREQRDQRMIVTAFGEL